jgi:hypothetical protein
VRASLTTSLLAIVLCAFASAALAADTAPVTVHNGGIVGLGVMTGTVFQEGQSSFSGMAVRLRVRNSALRPNVEFLPTLEYWQNNSHLDAFHIRTSRRDATLGTDVRWVFDSKKGWQPYVGAGFGLHFLNDEVQSPQTGNRTSGVVRGGGDVLGGVEFNLGARIGSFVELKFHDVSRFRQVKFNTGLGWNF